MCSSKAANFRPGSSLASLLSQRWLSACSVLCSFSGLRSAYRCRAMVRVGKSGYWSLAAVLALVSQGTFITAFWLGTFRLMSDRRRPHGMGVAHNQRFKLTGRASGAAVGLSWALTFTSEL